MDIRVRHECTVSGVLGFVLRLSRVYGVGALKHQRVAHGWRVQVSRAASAYGTTLAFIFCTLTWIHLITDFETDKDNSLYNSTGSAFVSLASAFLIALVVLAKVYLGTNGMQQMITCLAQLNKTNEELNNYRPARSTTKYQLILAAWILIVGHVTLITEGYLYYEEIFHKKSDFLFESIYVTCYISYLQVKVIVAQSSLMFVNVLSSFIHLNDCLAEILQQIIRNSDVTTGLDSNARYYYKKENNVYNKDCVKYINNAIDTIAVNGGDKSTNTTSSSIHHLGCLYNSLCEVVQHTDACHKLLLIPLLASFLLHLVITLYNLVTRLFGEEIDIYRSLVQVLWAVYHVTDLLAIVEPCHQTHEQIKRTKRLISSLIRAAPVQDYAMIVELKSFYKHLTLNEVYYAPMKMFKLNRNILTTVLGSITTYLIVLIQL